MLREVTSDLFGIAKRLRLVNKAYRVFWNGKRGRYEVHTIKTTPPPTAVPPSKEGSKFLSSNKQEILGKSEKEIKSPFCREGRDGLAFVVPYDTLDCRTLEYARKTRVENADVIEAEINAHNANLEQSARKSFEHANLRLEDMLRYAKHAGHSVNFTKNYIKEF